jgi:hypothetical protein
VTGDGIRALSPDGACRFEEGALRSCAADVAPFTIDFFERWTFARFLDERLLALGFESGQPWSEWGSYGDRYGGVQVLALTAPAEWSLVSLEYDYRAHDEPFVPDDVIWHPRGVLAWLRDGSLAAQVLAAPRGVIAPDPLPASESRGGLALCVDVPGRWRTLELDPEGRILIAADGAGADRFDLELRRRSRDGGASESLEA